MTSGQETERVYSYNRGARTGLQTQEDSRWNVAVPRVLRVRPRSSRRQWRCRWPWWSRTRSTGHGSSSAPNTPPHDKLNQPGSQMDRTAESSTNFTYCGWQSD